MNNSSFKTNNHGYKILIVEDSPTQAEKLKFLLEEHHFQVAVASNGIEAFRYLSTRQPDVIISDILMPEMDGYALCSKVKSDEKLRDIPVMLLTSLSDPEDVVKGLTSGADNFVTKPYNDKVLLSQLEYILINKKIRDSHQSDLGIEIYFGGKKHKITSNRLQIIDLLLSTYETAVQKRQEVEQTVEELKITQEELRTLNEHLEEKVHERTMRIEQLYELLRVIRNVNQLIVKTRDRDELIRRTCEIFTESRNFSCAWIVLMDENGRVSDIAESGHGEVFETVRSNLKNGSLPPCAQQALETKALVIIRNPEKMCPECPLSANKSNRIAFSIALRAGDTTFGVLNVGSSIAESDEEMISLFEEVAGDIGFALHDMVLEERHKQAEEALQASQLAYEDLYNQAPVGYHELDLEGRITRINQTELNMLGYSKEEMLGKSVWEFVVDKEISKLAVKQKLKGALANGHAFERSYRRKDGSALPVLIEDRILHTDDGRISGIRTIVQDVTELKQAEEEIRKYKMAIEYSHESIFITQVDGSITYVNPAFEHLYGYSADEVIGKTPRVIKSGQLSQEHYQKFWDALQAKQTIAGEIVNKTKDGRLVTVYVSDNPILDSEKKLVGFMSIQTDITEHKQAEEALRTSEAQLSMAMEISKLGYWEYDVADDLFTFNDHFYDIFRSTAEKAGGYKMSPAQYAERFLHPDDIAVVANEMKKAFETTDPDFSQTLEHRIIYDDGELGYISVRYYVVKDKQGRTIKTYGANQDITEQKRLETEKLELETQFRESQKMESIGTLAGGIAHDFNNLLTVIQGHAQLAMMEMDESNPQYKDLTQIMNSSVRASSLTRQLLMFSRKQDIELKTLDLNVTIQNLLKMVKRLIGEDIAVDAKLASGLSNVEADEGNLEQVIMNLAVNARDAMPEGGKLTITTENVSITDTEQILVPDSRLGHFVRISVADTGCGIPKEILSKIYEPFFSTKEKGKGTGLGLSVVYGIAKSHGGWINVYSEAQQGTVFKIYLPASAKASSEKGDVKTESKESLHGNGEQILVIEDEKGILDFASSALRQYGYVIRLASNGQQAESIFDEAKGSFQLIISDVVLPDINGYDLVSKLVVKYPDIPVIMCSGYTEERVKRSIIEEKGFRFLQKPYSLNALLSEVKKTIRSTRNP